MCQKEIGSEFWSVELSNKNNLVFDENTSWYLSGRVALKAIIQELRTK